MATRYPGVISEEETPSLDRETVERQLETLGFPPHQIRKALDFLTQTTNTPSPYLISLLNLPPLQACLSYLLLHTPESSLPAQFLNQQKASEAFVRGGASGTQSIASRWLVERAVKEAGWPEAAVIEAVNIEAIGPDWALLTEYLNQRLVGSPAEDATLGIPFEDDVNERDTRRTEEIDALVAVYPDNAKFDPETSELIITPPDAPEFELHVIFPPTHPYPSPLARPPPMYITSPSQPPYIRLHVLATILRECDPANGGEFVDVLDAGDGIIFAAMERANLECEAIRDSPPEVSSVMQYLLPKRTFATKPAETAAPKPQASNRKGKSNGRRQAIDDRDDATVKKDFDAARASKAYQTMLEVRKKLPTWDYREEIVRVVGNSRCVLVVGETGDILSLVYQFRL